MPQLGEVLSLYLEVSSVAVSSVLVRGGDSVPKHVYYVSKVMLPAKNRYLLLEKFALALIMTSRKPQHYFQAHLIQVLTDHPLKQVISVGADSSLGNQAKRV